MPTKCYELVFGPGLSKAAAQIVTTGEGKASGNIVPHSFLNGPMESNGQRLTIGAFSFSPRETEAELQERLNTNPPKKRR